MAGATYEEENDGPGPVPPHDIMAEMGVIGSMLLSREAADVAMQALLVSDFYKLAHQKLFDTIGKLVREKGAVDIILLRDALEREGLLYKVGGVAYLTELMDAVPSSAFVESYAAIVKDHSRRRAALKLREVLGEAAAPGTNVDELLARVEQGLGRVEPSGGPRLLREHLVEANERFEKLARGEKVGLPTGIRELDEAMMGGFEQGDLVVVCADTSVGKTAFASNVLLNIVCDQGLPAAVFSGEVMGRALAVDLARIRAGYNFWQVRAGRFEERELDMWEAANGELATAPLWVDDTGAIAIEELLPRASYLVRQRKVCMVAVDYIQLLTVKGGQRETETLRLAQIARLLKGLAQNTGAVVMALSQRTDMESGRRRTRYAPEIEHAADVVIWIDRDCRDYDYDADPFCEPDICVRDIIIGKGRHKGTSSFYRRFNKPLLRFEDLHGVPARTGMPEKGEREDGQ